MTMIIPVKDSKNPNSPYYAIIDDSDFILLSQFNWWAYGEDEGRNTVYAKAWINGKNTRMHKFLTGDSATDHINGIGLDNRRSNLRPCSQSDNAGNSQKPRRLARGPATSKFKGVYRRSNKWVAQIQRNNKNNWIGSFNTEEEAAQAYDDKAIEFFGNFARTNFRMDGLTQ